MPRLLALCLVLGVLAPARVHAEERKDSDTSAAHPAWTIDRPERRPSLLPVLYTTYAGLQATDIYTSHKALANGASETNPVMTRGTAGQIAIKAATGAATIYFVERAWKKNRVGAVVLMAALNGVTAAVVARNARHAQR